MKLVSFYKNDMQGIGSVIGDRIVDLTASFSSMLELIEAGDSGLAHAGKLTAAAADTIELSAVRLLAPLPRPVQMRDCLVFEEHLRNSADRLHRLHGIQMQIPDVWFRQPIYYKCNRMSVIGPGEPIRWPAYSAELDYELELACVIGRKGTDISVDEAPTHIFGYTIFNDVSARDAQASESAGSLGPAKGKDFDTGNILGPWIVTPDEVGNVYDLRMEVRVNGERRGGGTTASMHHSFSAMIAHISQSETIFPGEVIGSGTVGTGCGLETGQFLADGDVIELEIEKIGILRNQILRASAPLSRASS